MASTPKAAVRINRIFFVSPVAVARVGGSSRPREAYSWAEDPRMFGAGQTVIRPTTRLEVLPDGSIDLYLPLHLRFKDDGKIRPVCPFFELHAEYRRASSKKLLEGPLTLQLWTTCGYGDLQGGDSEDLWYTDQFSGTSSESPILVGVLGRCKACCALPVTPSSRWASARALLQGTGSPQQAGLAGGTDQRIGNQPDLHAIIRQLLSAAPKVQASMPATAVQTININFGDTKISRIVNINVGS